MLTATCVAVLTLSVPPEKVTPAAVVVTAAAVTTTAAGVTFSGGTESVNTATQVAVNISAGAAVPAGYYPATITDGAGTVTIANAFYVEAAPTVTAVTPATVAEGNTAIPVTLTGTGFAAGMTAVFGLSLIHI